MSGRYKNAGFTIIETILVLGISAILFLSAFRIFSGTRQRTQYTLAVRDTETVFQDIINDVSNGYYDNLNLWRCNGNAGTGSPNFTYTGTTDEQGTDHTCIFFGKAIVLAPNSSNLTVYPIVGNRLLGNGQPSNSYDAAYPTNVYSTNAPGLNIRQVRPLRYGIAVRSAQFINKASNAACLAGSTNAYIGGIFSDLSAAGTGFSGAQKVTLNLFNYSGAVTEANLGGILKDPLVRYNASANPECVWRICLQESPGSGRRSTLDISRFQDSIATELTIDSGC